jgi:hypothetical protein
MTVRLKLCWLLFTLLVVLPNVAISPLHTFLGLRIDSKSFFILTGVSALGWPVSLYLHDLLIKFFPTEPVTYVLVFYVLPFAFVAGVLGTIITGILQRKG